MGGQVSSHTRWCNQSHFWNHLRPHVAQAHALACQNANLFEALFEFLVGIEFGRRLVPDLPKSAARSATTGIRVSISVALIPSSSSTGLPVDTIFLNNNRRVSRKSMRMRGGAGRAGYRGFSFVANLAIGCGNVRYSHISGVYHVDFTGVTESRDSRDLARWQTGQRRQECFRGRRYIRQRAVEGNLAKEMMNIDSRPRRAGERIRPCW